MREHFCSWYCKVLVKVNTNLKLLWRFVSPPPNEERESLLLFKTDWILASVEASHAHLWESVVRSTRRRRDDDDDDDDDDDSFVFPQHFKGRYRNHRKGNHLFLFPRHRIHRGVTAGETNVGEHVRDFFESARKSERNERASDAAKHDARECRGEERERKRERQVRQTMNRVSTSIFCVLCDDCARLLTVLCSFFRSRVLRAFVCSD